MVAMARTAVVILHQTSPIAKRLRPSAITALALFPFSILHCAFGGVCNHAAFPE
jgi:hypothetical protein